MEEDDQIHVHARLEARWYEHQGTLVDFQSDSQLEGFEIAVTIELPRVLLRVQVL